MRGMGLMDTWIDMDPGIDDVLALLAAWPSGRLGGITTVAGNHDGAQTFSHACRVVAALGRSDLPVAQGSLEPLFYPLDTAASVHGVGGALAGIHHLPTSPQEITGHAVECLRDALTESAHALNILAIGPLTNLARCLWGSPSLTKKVEGVWIMGGSLRAGGNVSPLAEFNFWVDPHAADLVLRSGWPISLVGLDVTHAVLWADDELLELVKPFRGPLGRALREMVTHYAAFGHETHPDWPGVAIHDAVLVAAWEHPEWFRWEQGSFRVETGGIHTRGVLFRTQDGPGSVRVATGVCQESVRHWLGERLALTAQMMPPDA